MELDIITPVEHVDRHIEKMSSRCKEDLQTCSFKFMLHVT